MNASLVEIAALVQGVVIGDKNLMIAALSPIDNIIANALVFAEGSDNLKLAEASNAAAILVSSTIQGINKPIIQVANPFLAFIKLLHHFYPQRQPIAGIHPTAVIANHVTLGNNISIGPHVVIESGSVIGDNCVIKSHVYIGHDVKLGAHTTLHPHVTIYDKSQLGARVCIHASTVIGSDGFGYTLEDGQRLKVPHVGHVLIEDDVEIGANTVIDRATLATINNPFENAHIFAVTRPNKFPAFIFAEPIYVKNFGKIFNFLSKIKPVLEVSSHIVAAKREHRHWIASDSRS